MTKSFKEQNQESSDNFFVIVFFAVDSQETKLKLAVKSHWQSSGETHEKHQLINICSALHLYTTIVQYYRSCLYNEEAITQTR